MSNASSLPDPTPVLDRLAAIASLARYAANGRISPEVAADAIGKHAAAVAELVTS